MLNDTTTAETYTLSLHDALPIYQPLGPGAQRSRPARRVRAARETGKLRVPARCRDRKSTRLNSSHPSISYAVFCLKKKRTEGGGLHEQRRRDNRYDFHDFPPHKS